MSGRCMWVQGGVQGGEMRGYLEEMMEYMEDMIGGIVEKNEMSRGEDMIGEDIWKR